MVWRKLGPTTTRWWRGKVDALISLLLLLAFTLMLDVFSAGWTVVFVEGNVGGGGDAGMWIAGGGFGRVGGGAASGSPSNVGIAIAVTVMAGLAVAATIVYSNRGHLKSPWSRRRRKHALLHKQWVNLFDGDGRLCDGGVKLLTKVRSGGVDPSLRAEVWPFLLGVYSLNSSKEERDSVKAKNRQKYEILRKQCQQTYKRIDKSSNPKPTSGRNGNDSSKVCGQVHGSSDVGLETSNAPPRQESGCGRKDSFDNGTDTERKSFEDADDKPKKRTQETNVNQRRKEDKSTASNSVPYRSENFSTWQRIIRVDAIRANDEWVVYSPSQAAVPPTEAHRLAASVGLKDHEHLEPCRVFHAARLVSILEAYAMYDSEIGYCQGMSDLLSPIITVVEDDDEAFWCFVGFMNKARHNFRLDEVGIRRQLNMVSSIIKGKDMHLYRHLEQLQAEDCFFVYRMVVVLFRRELNFEQTMCLWEVMWADQAAVRAGMVKPASGGKMPPTDDLLLYAIAASVLQRRRVIIEKYSSMDEILRDCNSMAGRLDVHKILDDADDLVFTLHDKV